MQSILANSILCHNICISLLRKLDWLKCSYLAHFCFLGQQNLRTNFFYESSSASGQESLPGLRLWPCSQIPGSPLCKCWIRHCLPIYPWQLPDGTATRYGRDSVPCCVSEKDAFEFVMIIFYIRVCLFTVGLKLTASENKMRENAQMSCIRCLKRVSDKSSPWHNSPEILQYKIPWQNAL